MHQLKLFADSDAIFYCPASERVPYTYFQKPKDNLLLMAEDDEPRHFGKKNLLHRNFVVEER
jgi:hypothetical protein